ncbi:SOS response-associated peptidase [Kitasatospora purpeofusca]|uniref:SOS response-associated peptidase n=1 Tax=Kitasatospora purpeofusca TaxID=67352 RepID=UPI00225C417D|nr:SOS response-associated peptidase [Kitasatospora purpeofusca]MCX4683816.1 SOS response-associated peptidase [Kitasatospora purpeofusca]
MCGRFVSTTTPPDLAELLRASLWPTTEALAPSWNVAPTDEVASVLERVDRETGEIVRQVRSLRWGLVPSWSKDPGSGARMINARVETAAEKPAFRKAFKERRCVVPADGYFEWRPVPAADGRKGYKQPYYLHRPDGGLLLMAGLYEFWRDRTAPEDADTWLVTCTVLTTEATDAAGRIHDRMPVTLTADTLDAWLDPGVTDPAEVRGLLHAPAGDLLVRPVATTVNSVRNDGPQLLDAVADPLPEVTGGHYA